MTSDGSETWAQAAAATASHRPDHLIEFVRAELALPQAKRRLFPPSEPQGEWAKALASTVSQNPGPIVLAVREMLRERQRSRSVPRREHV